MLRHSRYSGLLIHPPASVNPSTFRAHTPPEAIQFNISHYTLEQLHELIRTSRNISDATLKLKVKGTFLPVFLAKANLDFATLQKTTPECMIAQFGDAYYQPLKDYRKKRFAFTLEEIHTQIIHQKTQVLVAKEFEVEFRIIKKCLEQFSYKNDMPLTFKLLKKLSVSEAQSIWRENYTKRIKIVDKRKRAVEEELDEAIDEAQQTALPIPTPTEEAALGALNVEEPCLVSYAFVRSTFFSPIYTAPMDSALTSTSCTTINRPTSSCSS